MELFVVLPISFGELPVAKREFTSAFWSRTLIPLEFEATEESSSPVSAVDLFEGEGDVLDLKKATGDESFHNKVRYEYCSSN